MRSKAEIILDCVRGKTVLDIGGVGYLQANSYEQEFANAWKTCERRIVVDWSPTADIVVDLNKDTLPKIDKHIDITVAFDVLEHLDRPIDVLRWIPSDKLVVSLPNSTPYIARRMEEKLGFDHLYSFTKYTASVLMKHGGWEVTKTEYQFGKWSTLARVINCIGSLPGLQQHVATGVILHCTRA